MPNYSEMYRKLFRASEQAIQLLISAQQECEELYLKSPPPEIQLIPIAKEGICPEHDS